MRKFKIVTFVLLGVTLLGTGVANRKTSSQERRSEKVESREQETDEVLAVVRKYISLSRDGKFEEIALITAAIPKDARRKTIADGAASTRKSELPPGTITVAGASPLLNHLGWIRKDFPKSVFDDKNSIVKVGELVVKDGLAKVSVNLGNDQVYSTLPWVFMMTREQQDGPWRIYNIATPAYAADYYP
jgi:hypothetical protein